MSSILEKITRLREQRGWSEYVLSERAEMTQSTISSWYSKDMIPTVSSLERICKAFGIILSQFFAEDGEPVVLSERQSALINRFNILSGEQQDALLAFLNTLK